MEEDHLTRKLAVILHADVVDSTLLVRQDETLAHQRIRDAFRRFSETIGNHGGTTQEIRGDALVAEFARVSDAVAAAVEFQNANGSYNEILNDDLRPVARIGIAMGEVVVADNTVTGEGIVLAQRLEQMAEPGGICLQGAAYETVPKRLPYEYADLGEHEVKGFEQPVRVYRVESSAVGPVSSPQPSGRQSTVRRYRLPIIASIVLIVVIVTAHLFQSARVEVRPASPEKMAFNLPEGPSIAVLPLESLSTDPDLEIAADGLTADLITDLSMLPGLFVIAVDTSNRYKGRDVEAARVAEELGVRYILRGSVRADSSRVRINLTLIDTTVGRYRLTERYDGSRDSIFDLQDSVTRDIATKLELDMTASESERRALKETNNVDAYWVFLEGWVNYRKFTPDGITRAIRLFEKAIELDPGFARAHAGLAAANLAIWENIWTERTGISYDDAWKATNRHLEQAMKDPTSLAYHTAARQHMGLLRWDQALAAATRAIDLDPNDPKGHQVMGQIQVGLGNPAEGLVLFEKAMRFDPFSDYSYLRGYALFHLQRYDEAADAFLEATRRNPDYEWSYLLLAATYGHLGREQEAVPLMARFNSMYHDPFDSQSPFTLYWVKEFFPLNHEADRERLREGMRSVGVPEGLTEIPENLRYSERVKVSAGTFDVEGAIEIDATEAKQLFDRGVRFIDSRGISAYNRGHVPGSINMLFHEVWENLSQVADKDEEIVFYGVAPGRDGHHLAAHSSAQALTLGYSRVYYFADGFTAWENAKYPIEN